MFRSLNEINTSSYLFKVRYNELIMLKRGIKLEVYSLSDALTRAYEKTLFWLTHFKIDNDM